MWTENNSRICSRAPNRAGRTQPGGCYHYGDTPTPFPRKTPRPQPESSTANADVTFVRAVKAADGSWTFHVTVSHPDTGWDDYADGWNILLPDSSKFLVHESDVFTRLLSHPHVDEQPFTRSQSGIIIPEDVTSVTVRAHDIVDGFGGQEIIIDLTKDSGFNYETERYKEK